MRLKLKSRVDSDGCLRLDVPTDLPAGEVDLELVIESERQVQRYDFSDLAGKLRWRGDALAGQPELRDEWRDC